MEDGVLGRFLVGRRRADFRNSIREVLPEFLVPMTRILLVRPSAHGRKTNGLQELQTYLRGVGSLRLRTLRGLLLWLSALRLA